MKINTQKNRGWIHQDNTWFGGIVYLKKSRTRYRNFRSISKIWIHASSEEANKKMHFIEINIDEGI